MDVRGHTGDGIVTRHAQADVTTVILEILRAGCGSRRSIRHVGIGVAVVED